jgi:hypothetical protein
MTLSRTLPAFLKERGAKNFIAALQAAGYDAFRYQR